MSLYHRASSLEAEWESRSRLSKELLLQAIPARMENAFQHQIGSKPLFPVRWTPELSDLG